MVRSRLAFIFGAVVVAAFVTVPANAQDDIATKAQACSICHGQNGEPTDPKTIPVIWGQQSNYLYKELQNFQSGERNSPIMSPIAKGFSLDDLRKLASYFAAKTWPARQTTAAAGVSPEGSAMCKACHGQNFEGGAPAPRLAGLSYEYLLGAMNGFADGQRTNNLDMPGFMQALSESQRQAIARYLAGL